MLRKYLLSLGFDVTLVVLSVYVEDPYWVSDTMCILGVLGLGLDTYAWFSYKKGQ
jgi:hypothetical protein